MTNKYNQGHRCDPGRASVAIQEAIVMPHYTDISEEILI